MRDTGLTVCTDCALRLYTRSPQGNDVVSMARILVTEAIAPGGLDRLRAAGHDVDVQEGLSDDDLKLAIAGAHALIIRSATQVTEEVLASADSLIAVGRANITNLTPTAMLRTCVP